MDAPRRPGNGRQWPPGRWRLLEGPHDNRANGQSHRRRAGDGQHAATPTQASRSSRHDYAPLGRHAGPVPRRSNDSGKTAARGKSDPGPRPTARSAASISASGSSLSAIAVHRALAEIIRRAQHDPAFRQLCLENPAGAVKEVSNEPLPPEFKLRFVDNDHANLVVVLPDLVAPESSDHELSDDELSAVSGGIAVLNTSQSLHVQTNFSSPLIRGACFAGGTPVLMADGTWRPIAAIDKGAAVLAFDEQTGRVLPARVSQRLDHAPEAICRAVIEDLDRELLVTSNHPFYCDGRWRRIGELAPQSELFHFDATRAESTPRRLRALEPTGHRAPVFNLEVEEAHSYFVEGMLVHNGGVLK